MEFILLFGRFVRRLSRITCKMRRDSQILMLTRILAIMLVVLPTLILSESPVGGESAIYRNLDVRFDDSPRIRHTDEAVPMAALPQFDKAFKSCVIPHKLIECNAKASAQIGTNFSVECMPAIEKTGVLRIIGEYDVLTIECKADFNLDFDYDGFQVKIFSNAALHRLYSDFHSSKSHSIKKSSASTFLDRRNRHGNETDNEIINPPTNETSHGEETAKMMDFPRIGYSRTGNYTFRGMHRAFRHIQFPFYLFLEEPGLKPKIMFNNLTKPSVTPSNKIQVPCRPSHYETEMEIHRIHDNKRLKIAGGDYDPVQGFVVPVEATRDLVIFQVVPTTFGIDTWKFECITENHSVNMSYPGGSTENAFGFDTVPQPPPRSPQPPVNVEANPVTEDPITVSIACIIDDPSRPDPYLGVIGYDNPSEIRLVQEFVLPSFYNQSYSVQVVRRNSSSASNELRILRGKMTGMYYCEAGSSYNKAEEYAIALNKKYYRLDFGTNYAILPHTSPPSEAHVQLRLRHDLTHGPLSDEQANDLSTLIKLIAGRAYNFSCRVDTFTMGRTIVWGLGWTNGSRTVERIDYKFKGEFRYFSLVATWDLANISCSTPYWNMDLWQTSQRKLIIAGEEIITSVGVYSIIGAVVLIVISILLFLLYRKQKKEHWRFTRPEIAEFETGNPYVSMHEGLHEGGSNLPYDKRYEIDPKHFKIVYEQILGQGEYGIVYSGFVDDTKVGVKTVKNYQDKPLVKALLAELKIMIYLGHHHNILHLVGAYTANLRRGNVLVFLEYCELGSLESYLRKHRYELEGINSEPSAYTKFAILNANVTETEEEKPKPLTLPDLFIWCYQIAHGMSYLSDKKVIHGDLATRNVLLTSNKVAKICDFGLSRRLHNYKTYLKSEEKKSQPLPWAWMAPEALQNFAFSVESDVWSFGITVWEIFSMGARPYPGIGFDLDFLQRLRNGLRNLKPELAPNELYREIMKECWRYDPQDRPSFTELCINLEYFMEANAPTESRQSLSSGSDSGVCVTVVNNTYDNCNHVLNSD